VKLNSPDEIKAAFTQLMDSAKKYDTCAELTGVLIMPNLTKI